MQNKEKQWVYMLQKHRGWAGHYTAGWCYQLDKTLAQDFVKVGVCRLATDNEIKKAEQILEEDIDDDLNRETIAVSILQKEKNQVITKTAEYVKKKLNILTMKDTEEMLYHNDGIYHEGANIEAKKEIESMWGELATTRDVNEIIGHIQRSSYIDRDQFHRNPELICLENGILNLEIGELEQDTGEKFLWKIPVEYNPDANCPQIDKFIREVVYEPDIPTIYELIGYCLYPQYQIQKAFMFTGDGANGKSTLLSLIKNFLGVENITSLSLQELEKNNFAKGYLYGKLANIYPDLPDYALKTTGTFKMLTGGDLISSDRKFKGRIEFVNHAKLIYSANKAPEAHDDTDAFYRRWVMISCPNTFNEENRDIKILEKLTTPEELSGLLNKAITALYQLMDKGDFTTTKTTDEVREDYIRKSDPVKAFVMDCLEQNPDGIIVKSVLYSVFVEYCRIYGLPPKTSNMFTKDLRMSVHFDDSSKVSVGGKQHKANKGIKFTESGVVRGILDKLKDNTNSTNITLFSYCGKQNEIVSNNKRKNSNIGDNGIENGEGFE